MLTSVYQNLDEDYSDLFDFLEYINTRWVHNKLNKSIDFGNHLNIDQSNLFKFNNANIFKYPSSKDSYEKGLYENLPVALVQLLILILVFFIFYFMCKCNKIMESFRDKKENKKTFDGDKFQDSIKFRNYLCYSWNKLKLNYCIRRRRRRRFRHNHRHVFTDFNNNDKRRNDSLIFRRRSVIYRNSKSNRKLRQSNLKTNREESKIDNKIEPTVENSANVNTNNNIFINSASIQTIDEIRNISKAFIDQFEESTIV
jgi:hypothetical protein